jgi:hypothetical protein
MKWKNKAAFVLIIAALLLNACSFSATPTPTATPSATNTPAPTSTKTPTPTITPLPTRTPNLTATQRTAEWNAEIQKYFEEGYIGTVEGKIKKLPDFAESWAQLDWYTTWNMGETVSNFVLSAHFEWANASKTPNPSGCGIVFAIQEDGGDFSVFLDQKSIIYLHTKYNRGYYVGRTRGSGKVNIETPAKADFALIVYDYYSYVIVDGEVVGEYSLPQSDNIEGDLGISILSGTNKGTGTTCEITNMRLWTPNP